MDRIDWRWWLTRWWLWGTALLVLVGLWELAAFVWGPVAFWKLWGRELDHELQSFRGFRKERRPED